MHFLYFSFLLHLPLSLRLDFSQYTDCARLLRRWKNFDSLFFFFSSGMHTYMHVYTSFTKKKTYIFFTSTSSSCHIISSISICGWQTHFGKTKHRQDFLDLSFFLQPQCRIQYYWSLRVVLLGSFLPLSLKRERGGISCGLGYGAGCDVSIIYFKGNDVSFDKVLAGVFFFL